MMGVRWLVWCLMAILIVDNVEYHVLIILYDDQYALKL